MGSGSLRSLTINPFCVLLAGKGFLLFLHEFPEQLLYPMRSEDIRVNLAICVELLEKFGKSAGKNVLDYETSILKAKLGYGKGIIMPRKKKEQNASETAASQPVRSGNARWLNVPLSEEHVAQIDSTEYTLEDVGARLLLMATNGWDITIKSDSKSGGHSCFGFIDDPNNTTDRVGLSGWASNPADAAFVFLYKYFNVLGEAIPEGTGTNQRRFR